MRTLRSTSVALVAAAIACAHGGRSAPVGPSSGPAVSTGPVWPAPPSAPRVRWAASATQSRPAATPAWWKRAFYFIAGVDAEDSAAASLERPFDVSVRADGSFVLADPDGAAVLEYARDGTFARALACANHPWAAPMSVAVAAADGAVWVADAGDASIVRWTASGCRVVRVDGLQRPTGIAVGARGVAVVDPPAHAVLLLSEAGQLLARVGARGSGESEFNFPSDVAAAPDGSLYVVDALNFRIVHLGPDGRWLGAFGARGESGAALARPKGVAVDAAGRVYVTDAQRDVALIFRPDGTLEYLLGESGPAPGQLAHPAGVSIGGGRLVIANSVNRRAEIFELVGEPR